MNSLITAAVSSGTSTVGNWLSPSKRCTEHQGCSLANASCTERNSGARGWQYTWSTETGGLKLLNTLSGSPSSAYIARISRPARDHISKPWRNIWLRVCVSTEAGAPLNHIVNNCSAPRANVRHTPTPGSHSEIELRAGSHWGR